MKISFHIISNVYFIILNVPFKIRKGESSQELNLYIYIYFCHTHDAINK